MACCASASWRVNRLDGRLLPRPCANAIREPMTLLNGTDAAALTTALLAWWERHGRVGIPWKLLPGGGRPAQQQQLDPYGIWIAEVMLQQTQLAVVLPYWGRWMEAFPTVEALAASSLDKVRVQWQGLGYYARARRLHEAAQLLVGGPWPLTLQEWMALPGIGRTTAGSILSSAFNSPLPILDGNVKRVLARFMAHPHPLLAMTPCSVSWSEALLDPVRSRDTNQALMDLGATLCTPRQPDCPVAPGNLTALLTLLATHRWPVTDAPSLALSGDRCGSRSQRGR